MIFNNIFFRFGLRLKFQSLREHFSTSQPPSVLSWRQSLEMSKTVRCSVPETKIEVN